MPNKKQTTATLYHNPFAKVSTRMALFLSVMLPLVETIRRSNQLNEIKYLMHWFDDYMLGAVMFIAAFRVLKNKANAIAYLIAAWGIATGALFISFLGQFQYLEAGATDPGIFPPGVVAIGKGLILTYILVGLQLAIKAQKFE